MRKLLVSFSVAIAFLAFFTSCSKDQTINDAVKINVLGYVVNSQTGLPVKDVTITYTTLSQVKTTKSDNDGKYIIQDVFASSTGYLVKFSKSGFLTDARFVGGTSSVTQLGSLPYQEVYDGSIVLDTLSNSLSTTIYVKTDNGIDQQAVLAKNLKLVLKYSNQTRAGMTIKNDTIVTTDANGQLNLSKLPYASNIALDINYSDANYKTIGNIATKNASSFSKEYTVTLNSITTSFGISTSDVLTPLGKAVEDFDVNTDITVTFNQTIDTTGLTSGGNNTIFNKASLSGGASTYTQRATISSDLKTITVKLSFTAPATSLQFDTQYKLSLSSFTSTSKVYFSPVTINFKTKKRGA